MPSEVNSQIHSSHRMEGADEEHCVLCGLTVATHFIMLQMPCSDSPRIHESHEVRHFLEDGQFVGADRCIRCGAIEGVHDDLLQALCNPRPYMTRTAADVLAEMADTFRKRNAVYGDNFRMVGAMMRILFPQGVDAALLHSDQFHLFELMLVKLSRFAVSKMQHKDSIHDSAVYAAMIEAILDEQDSGNRG